MIERPEGGPTLEGALDSHRAGRLDEAADVYRQLYEHDPGNVDACYGLGTVLMQQGEYEHALELLDQAATAAPDVPEFVFNHACVLQQLGQRADAANGFMRAAGLAAADPSMLVDICARLMALRHHYAAAGILSAATQRLSGSRIVWLAYARALGGVRDYKAAIRAHEQALTLGPANAADLLSYADLLFMARQPEAAQDALRQSRVLGSEDPRALYLEARCERIAGNRDRERELLAQAIDARPAYGDAWQFLLETTPDEELPAFIEDCKRHADDGQAPIHDRVVLSYTAGRALERLQKFEPAFELYAVANERQQRAASSRGVRYDREASEAFVARVCSRFDAPHGVATNTAADTQPIFIVGMPRSGTTLVERILGGLDGVVTGGESEALELVVSQYYRALDHGATRPIRDLQRADWDELAEHYWRLQTGPRSRLTDKMPTNFRHVGMICGMFPNAPIIYVQRDPRDVALSIFSRLFPDGHPYATDLDDLAHYYSLSVAMMSHWQDLYPERIATIDYEQLVREPEEQTRTLAKVCGLEWRPECLDFHERRDASFTFSELQVREPINAKGIGRWRKYAQALAPFIQSCVAHGVQLRDN